MTRKTFNEDTPLPPHGYVKEQPHMPCSRCGNSTPVETLNNLGSWCGRCYTAYCQAAMQDDKPPAVDRDAMTPAAYCAMRLRAKPSLNSAQKSMLESCERMDRKPAEDDPERFTGNPKFAAWEAGRP